MQETTPFIATGMRCNQEEFEAIRPKLEALGIEIKDVIDFKLCPYLVNNMAGVEKVVTNTPVSLAEMQGRKRYSQWNEQTFINNLGGQPYNDFEQVLAERYKQKEEAPPTYDRAEMATKIMCAMIPVLKTTDTELIADDAVKITDALIERLNQKP